MSLPRLELQISKFRDEFGFLSNMFRYCIIYKGITYLCSESAYQASKFDNPVIKIKISKMDGKDAKRYARRNKHLTSDGFHERKLEIMEEILTIKFSHPILKQMLLNTGDAELIEGNYWKDYFWGVCDGVGRNELGKILMKVRDKIKRGEI